MLAGIDPATAIVTFSLHTLLLTNLLLTIIKLFVNDCYQQQYYS